MNVIKTYPCNPSNYKKGRAGAVKYLVIHYVGALGNGAQNARYYHTAANLQASAHYFVGHASEGCPVYQSVDEGDTAWHCGGKKCVHPECRNGNAIGIEMCCHQDKAGRWYFDAETVDKTVALAREIMARRGIGIDHVIRHYDVTGKCCPAPFVKDASAWAAFKGRLAARENAKGEDMKRYHWFTDMPAWARESAEKAYKKGILSAGANGAVDVYECNLQVLAWMDRLGLLEQ